jgi:hypothetical protein
MLKNNRICGNGETGLMATGVARVSLDGNSIVENGVHQIFVPWLADEHVEATSIDYETRHPVRIRTTGWSLTNNIIGGPKSALLFSVGRWPSFFDSLESDHNTWYQDGRKKVFDLRECQDDGSRVPVLQVIVEQQVLARHDASISLRGL